MKPRNSEPIDILAVQRALEREPRQLADAESFAAVAVVLRQTDGAGLAVLLIERAHHERDPWSGHMAFPGGRRDDDDPTLFHTAVRETREELGIDLAAKASFLGCLDDASAVARGRAISMIIRPHVFHLREPVRLVPDPKEVADVLWLDLTHLASGDADTRYRHRVSSSDPGASKSEATLTYDLPAFDASGRPVWGLTYAMLTSLLVRVHRI